MLNISCASCLGLSLTISLQFSVEMCAASKIAKNLLKKPLWGFRVVQSHRCW